MYSTHNKRKSVIPERFIRTLKNKIYTHIRVVPNNAYIDKLDDIIIDCNNTYHRTVKMKLLMLKIMDILTLLKNLMIKIVNLKFLIMLEYQNTKPYLLKDILQIGLKTFL